MRKVHIVRSHGDPGVCGAGNGQKARARVIGVSLDELAAHAKAAERVTCARCQALSPMWIATAAEIKRRQG